MAFLLSSQANCGERELIVSDWLPSGYVTDGSVSYQDAIQSAIDKASETGARLRFVPMDYFVTEHGWRLSSNLALDLHGATFRFSEACHQDGALFRGDNVSNVAIQGGEIVGRNDVWKDGVNIRGIHITGQSKSIQIRNMHMRNLSSNGIGIFGNSEANIQHVVVEGVSIENCCKRYPEYLSSEKSEPGSVREDQGDIALYYVDDFRVQGCRLERSRSDETHIYRSRNGQICDNLIQHAKMGGYFLETCENVIGRGNIVLKCGSRGATIERGCLDCIFADNIVRESGREGLWAPDCIGLVVTGNVFDRNGRKANGPEPRYIWNANITINEAYKEPTNTPTQDYLISNNLIRTSADQIAAIRIDAVAATKNIVVRGNILTGENRKILAEGLEVGEIKIVDDNFVGKANAR